MDVPQPEIIDNEEHFEVEEILDSCFYCHKLQFLVAWKGFGYEENTWTNADDVHAADLVTQCYCDNPAAPRQICAAQFMNIPFQLACRGHAQPRGGVM